MLSDVLSSRLATQLFSFFDSENTARLITKKNLESVKKRKVLFYHQICQNHQQFETQIEKTVRTTISNYFDAWICFCHWWQKCAPPPKLEFFLNFQMKGNVWEFLFTWLHSGSFWTLFNKSNFCPKIPFCQKPNIFTSFSPKYFWQFSREI